MKDLFEVGLKYAQEDMNLHTFSTEMQYIHKDGRILWGQSNISLIRDEDNKIVEILGVTRNIDARKKMEHDLMLEKERLRAMIEAFDGYIYICSSDFVIEFMNEKLVERTGYDGKGKKCYEVLHDLEDKCEWCVNDRIQAGESVRWEVLSPKDNRWYSVSNTPIFNPDGTISKQAMIHDITDAKLAEFALKEKEEKFRSLIELAVDGIVIGDINGMITDVNEKFLEMTMKSKDEITGRHISILFAGEELHQKPLRFDLLQEGQTVVNERTIIRSDGSKLIVEMHSKRMPNGTHQAFMRDITTRKHAEAQINEQKRFLETLILNLPGIVYRCKNDRDWTMTFMGGRCLELTGYNPEDFLMNKARTFNSIIHKDYQDLIWRKWQNCLKNKTNFVEEYIIHTADGLQKWVYEQGLGVYDDNGKVIAIEGLIMDITDRKRAEELMIRSQFNYKMLAGHNQLLSRSALVFTMAETIEELETMIVSYFQKLTGASMVMLMKYEATSHEFFLRQYAMSDKIKNYILNIFGEEAFGHPVTINEKIEKEMLNQGVIRAKTLEEISYSSFPAELLEELQKAANFHEIIVSTVQRQGKLIGKMTAFIEDQSEIPVEIIKTYAQIAGFALSRKKTEIDLIKAKEKAEMSDRMKTVFLANISHEVKTPMNAILGFAELLEKPDLDTPKRLKYSEIIQKAGNQLLVIIDDLVDLAKIESGQMKIQNIRFDVIQLLQSLYEMFLPKFRTKDLGFYLKLSQHQNELLLESDPVRVRQILINLLDNAFKYSNSGEVAFGYTIDEDMIQFYVKDTGIGIHSSDAMRIFERFVKLEELHSDQYGGKGLGLSISKSLAEMLGGQIHLESAVHKGSVFYLNLPLKRKS
jgi:PAS domain S-box-containing protein